MRKVLQYRDQRGISLGSGKQVFKIAMTYSRVREFLASESWEFQGKDEEMEMDSFRNKKTGKKLFVEDISEDFPVDLLYGRA